MRPGRDGALIGTAVAVGLELWVREIKLKPAVEGSKLIKNGWRIMYYGWRDQVGGCVKQFGIFL